MPSRSVIEDFLAQQHLAVVGVSRELKAFPNTVAAHLRSQGRVVYLVNAHTDRLGDDTCYRSVAAVPDPLDGVIVMVRADAAVDVVRACIARGVPRVWLHRGAGPGASSPEAVELCREAGISVVDGACPMMFAEPVGWFHKTHGWFVRKRFAA
jgi:predicted CoA-binding protein